MERTSKAVIILIIVLTLAPCVLSQEQVVHINEFRGINTIAGDFSIKPNEARQAHEIDLSRNLGSLTVRRGYDSLITITHLDSIVGLKAMYYDDGTQRFYYVTDPDSTGYGQVLRGAIGTVASDLEVAYNGFPVQTAPYFTAYNNVMYITTEDGRGVLDDGEICREYPLRAPGEMLIVPLVGEPAVGYGLSGEYWYALYYVCADYEDADTVQGYLSQPVDARDGKVWLSGFQRPQGDSTHPFIASDSIDIIITRTRANCGTLGSDDSLFTVTSVRAAYGDTWGDIYYIDSIPDATIVENKSYPVVDEEWLGRSSLCDTGSAQLDSSNVQTRLGAPSFLGATYKIYRPTQDGVDTSTASSGIFHGIPEMVDTLGVSYILTWVDTLSGIESDSSRSMVVNHWLNIEDTTRLETVTLGVPNYCDYDSSLAGNVYRALLYVISHDTGSYQEVKTWEEDDFKVSDGFDVVRKWVEKMALDTVIITDYYLVGQTAPGDSTFIDSVRFDSLVTKTRFYRTTSSTQLKSPFTLEGKIFACRGSGLHYSLADSVNAWRAFRYVSLDQFDGDEGMLTYPTQGGVMFSKNKTTYVISKDANGAWTHAEITGLPGCIATRSYARGCAGHYYLSEYGVVRITDGTTLERRYGVELVSKQLNNFDNLSIASKRTAQGAYIPSSRQYLLCIGDTTYVYDERADGWTTWSMTFAGADLYAVEAGAQFVPGDSLYFIKPGDSTVFRYGGSTTDNGEPISMWWKSAPLFVDRNREHIRALGVWTSFGVATDSVMVYRYDEAENPALLITDCITGATSRYTVKSMEGGDYLYQRLGIGAKRSIINGLDIYYMSTGPTGMK